MAAVLEKLKRGTFKHIEAELYAYWDTVKEIKRIRAEIIGASPEPDEVGGGRGNLPGDPTARAATALLMHRRLEQMERITSAIRSVYEELPEEKQRLIRLRYWTKPQTLTWEGIAQRLHISRRQALYWRDHIVKAIAERLGWR
jgi:RinA family phage transcriptional activator